MLHIVSGVRDGKNIWLAMTCRFDTTRISDCGRVERINVSTPSQALPPSV